MKLLSGCCAFWCSSRLLVGGLGVEPRRESPLNDSRGTGLTAPIFLSVPRAAPFFLKHVPALLGERVLSGGDTFDDAFFLVLEELASRVERLDFKSY